jgi:hypothetical protein
VEGRNGPPPVALQGKNDIAEAKVRASNCTDRAPGLPLGSSSSAQWRSHKPHSGEKQKNSF